MSAKSTLVTCLCKFPGWLLASEVSSKPWILIMWFKAVRLGIFTSTAFFASGINNGHKNLQMTVSRILPSPEMSLYLWCMLVFLGAKCYSQITLWHRWNTISSKYCTRAVSVIFCGSVLVVFMVCSCYNGADLYFKIQHQSKKDHWRRPIFWRGL